MRMKSEPSKVQPATDWQILFRVKLSQESWTQVGTDAVRNDIFPTVEELGRENGNGYSEKGISYDNEDTSLGHKVVSDDGWVSQWMADGHIVIDQILAKCSKAGDIHTRYDKYDLPPRGC